MAAYGVRCELGLAKMIFEQRKRVPQKKCGNDAPIGISGNHALYKNLSLDLNFELIISLNLKLQDNLVHPKFYITGLFTTSCKQNVI